ncbi:mitochondrial outer membrane protein SLC25A46 isoform X2 [Syngnathoides biaculeatus]|nr:mitochondrial outer membrane protein SLC25A46 isoform X2 [Syngnathoides biaculeatus]XP_061656669.1 mitochondrial outer membrane protein SLC25A46 isoform X2 [Syngnathoides biaculeatus]XP_061656672.1 mitochondrial outer membrane protein SLC25A46 isoform X2 [Syngnathoides biaculeatus]
MASRRPDGFDGLAYRGGRDEPPHFSSAYSLRSGPAEPPQHLHWVTTPPDIPGSRNLHSGERTPLYDEPPGAASDWDATTGQAGGPLPPPPPPPPEQLNRLTGFGIGLVSLFAENVLTHPCVVFRRQCQVNYHAQCNHLSPFSALAVMYAISKAQGPRALWKGMGSTFIVHGVTLGAEGVISEFTPLPREIPHRWSAKQLAGHFLLKGLTAMVALPFYCSSLIETVQSEIARDESSSGLLDCVREGFARLLGAGAPHSRRLLPLGALLLPAACHAVLRYAVAVAVQRAALWLHRRGEKPGRGPAADPLEAHFPELAAAWLGSLAADALAYPLETTLHRLSLQGTRTIIDATDGAGPAAGAGNGGGPLVLPVNTQYDGLADCVHAIRRKEGRAGFYRGFGALAAQFALHGALLAGARTLLRLLLLEGKVG